jgi:hypothetical protein
MRPAAAATKKKTASPVINRTAEPLIESRISVPPITDRTSTFDQTPSFPILRSAQRRPNPNALIISIPLGLVGDGTTGIGGRVLVGGGVGVFVGVFVRVFVGVGVLVGVGVGVGKFVGVGVLVGVGVGVPVGKFVGVGVLVGVGVGVGVLVGVGVGVGVGTAVVKLTYEMS